MERITCAPAVASLLAQGSPEAELARLFVAYSQALISQDATAIDRVVAPNVRCHELEAAGLPPGVFGLKLFRQQANIAFPDEAAHILSIRTVSPDTIETELDCSATHEGEFLGIPRSGRKVRFRVQTRNRFENGLMAERWDKMDVPALIGQLTGTGS